jgi:2-methylcitrate dehydratase
MWIVAASLVWGRIKIEHYDDIRNPAVLSLMKKMEVKVDPELDRMYPKAFPNRITLVMNDGRKFEEQVDYAKGHPKNPLTDKELEGKFNELSENVLPADQRKKLLDKLWSIEKYTISDIIEDTII